MKKVKTLIHQSPNILAIKDVLDSFPFYVFLVDRDHHIFLANEIISTDFNLTPEEVIGKYCPKVIHGLDEPFSGCPLEVAAETGQVSEKEFFDESVNRWFLAGVYPTPFTTPEGKEIFLHTAVDITDRKKAEQEKQNILRDLRKALGGTIQVIARIVEKRDPYTAGHHRRVSDLARIIATEMNLTKEQINAIRLAGSIHDIGKISVPSEILSKPGKLLDMEFELIKMHPETGYDILKEIDFPWPIADIVLQHHERLDGSGYPNGLSGDKICIEAKVLNVADTVEAMATDRPYRPALGIEKALEEISENRGRFYDPDVVDACLKIFETKKYKFD